MKSPRTVDLSRIMLRVGISAPKVEPQIPHWEWSEIFRSRAVGAIAKEEKTHVSSAINCGVCGRICTLECGIGVETLQYDE